MSSVVNDIRNAFARSFLGFIQLAVVARIQQHLYAIKAAFEHSPVFCFTHLTSVQDAINFLGVKFDCLGNRYITSEYRKATNTGAYMNAGGECPERYKTYMMKALIRRT